MPLVWVAKSPYTIATNAQNHEIPLNFGRFGNNSAKKKPKDAIIGNNDGKSGGNDVTIGSPGDKKATHFYKAGNVVNLRKALRKLPRFFKPTGLYFYKTQGL